MIPLPSPPHCFHAFYHPSLTLHGLLPHCRPGRSITTTTAAAAANSGGGAGRKITQNEFTDKAWQAIVAAPGIAEEYNQQVGGWAGG